MPGVNWDGDIAEMGGQRSAWFTDSEGNVMCLDERSCRLNCLVRLAWIASVGQAFGDGHLSRGGPLHPARPTLKAPWRWPCSLESKEGG